MLYSLPVGETIVRALLARGANVIFRPHPFSYDFPTDAEAVRRIQQLLAADARRSGRAHVWGAEAEQVRSILDCINSADAMVSDVSSVVSDFLFSGKPLAMVAVPSEPDRFVAEYPIARAAYVIRGDLTNAESALDQLLASDPMASQRTAVRTDYLGDFGADDYAAAFVQAVRSLDRARRSTERTRRRTRARARNRSPPCTDPRRRLQAIRRLVGKVARRRRRLAGAGGIGLRRSRSAPAAVWAALVGLTLVLAARSGRIMLTAPHRAAARSGVAEPARALLIVTFVLVGASADVRVGRSARWWLRPGRRAHLRVPRSVGYRSITRWSTPAGPANGGPRPRRPCWPPATVVTLALASWWSAAAPSVAAGGSADRSRGARLARTPSSAASIARATGRLREELTRLRPGVCGVFLLPGRCGLSGRDVAALPRPDRPAVHHGHPDRADDGPGRAGDLGRRRAGAGHLPADPAQPGRGDRRRP